MDFNKIFDNIKPFDLDKHQKQKFLTDILKELTLHHYSHSHHYRKILDAYQYDVNAIHAYFDIPFLPVRVFKEYKMISASEEDIVKTMTSSGTTGQRPSTIFVDKKTSVNQSKIMVKIVSSFISSTRLPLLIIDTESVHENRNAFSARAGAILGFHIFGRDRLYALDEYMQIRVKELDAFLEKHKGKEILVFGFTFMIWLHFCLEMKKMGMKLQMKDSVLIHGGGWKKLSDQLITKKQFKDAVYECTGIEKVHDYYGMVEQGSSIYMECEYGHLHASSFSDVIIRRSKDFTAADFGEEGIIQALSISPVSYPGHSILTEDKGILLGEDDCPCGRRGKYFEVIGRIAKAEGRGCSDTYGN